MKRRLANAFVIDPQDLHASLLAIILRTILVLGVAVYVPSVAFALAHRLYAVVALDTVVLAATFTLALVPRVPYRWRAYLFCALIYVLGIGLLLTVGSICQIYLFGFSILSALLLGFRTGMAAALLSSGTLLALGCLGLASSQMGTANTPTTWLIVTLNFTLVNMLLTLTIAAVLAAVNRALRREIAGGLALAHERKLLRTLIDALPDIVFTTDTAGRVVSCNTAALAVFGMEREAQLVGKTVFDLFEPALARQYHAADQALMTGGRLLNQELPAGGDRWFQSIKAPLHDPDGAVIGMISIRRDITDRRRAEAERTQLESQLRHAQKMDGLGQLAGGIAHDFNNLLTVVLGCASVLLEDLKDNDVLRHEAEEIHGASSRAAELTRQLLLFSRRQVLAPAIVDVGEVLTGVCSMLRRLVGSEVELALIAPTAAGRVCADQGLLEQVIVNLTVNARDAMPGGGKVTLAVANVELDEAHARTHLGTKPGPYVMLSVADTGVGMDEATLARIFEPFFTTKEIGKGTGLGLSTVFGIVQQACGSITVDSAPGAGTTFKIHLPRVELARAAAA